MSDTTGVSPATKNRGEARRSIVTIPRLISVVDVIKREYLAAMNATKKIRLAHHAYCRHEIFCSSSPTELRIQPFLRRMKIESDGH
ncbi:hypothetical protein BC827DRAFT_22736 [Russula dissimulans]|nr:hypothetical protein BC827DRAFT_22736 [Russula dissimulans]